MPLVGGDMCPIAIDVVEKFQIIAEPAAVEAESPLHSIVDDEELAYEDIPKIEQYEDPGAHIYEDDYSDFSDHVIPVKGEHHELVDDEYHQAEHIIPEKGEHSHHDVHHLPKEHWTPDFHGPEEEDFRHYTGQ